MNFRNYISKKIVDHNKVISNSSKNYEKVSSNIYYEIKKCFLNKKTLFTCGNGGSASDALHFSGEFVSKFKTDKRPPLNCICLNSNISAITSIGNDFNFKKIFSRQLSAHGFSGDLLFLFSTSGKSLNIIEAAKIAKKMGIKIILFTGVKKTNLHDFCDIIFQVKSDKTDLIQEAHIFYYHIICDYFENYK